MLTLRVGAVGRGDGELALGGGSGQWPAPSPRHPAPRRQRAAPGRVYLDGTAARGRSACLPQGGSTLGLAVRWELSSGRSQSCPFAQGPCLPGVLHRVPQGASLPWVSGYLLSWESPPGRVLGSQVASLLGPGTDQEEGSKLVGLSC